MSSVNIFPKSIELVEFAIFCFSTLINAALLICSWQSDQIKLLYMDRKTNRHRRGSIHSRFIMLCP